MKTYAAIDLGFGYVKFSKATPLVDNPAPTDCLSFPALACPVDGNPADEKGSITSRIDVVDVTVANQRYQVGPGILDFVTDATPRVTSDHFFRSNVYRAIYLGALAYVMADAPSESKLDLLVVGLPLTVYQDATLRNEIRALLTRTHEVPVPGSPGLTRTVEVIDALILPQTVGSLYCLASSGGVESFNEMAQVTNLLIDVGFGTLMWMVSRGTVPQANRSGANMGGAHTLLSKVMMNIDPSKASKTFVLDELDACLRNVLGHPKTASLDSVERAAPGFMNKIVRKDVDPLRIATVLRTVTQTYMAEMVAKVNNLDGIDIVWLTGGACHLYASEVRRLFPGRDIRVDQKDPRFSNVRGFHMFAGETLRE